MINPAPRRPALSRATGPRFVRSANEALTALRKALHDLAIAEYRFDAVLQTNRTRHPQLPTSEADIRVRTDHTYLVAQDDWRTAHTRVQSYGAAANALLVAEYLRPDGEGAEIA